MNTLFSAKVKKSYNFTDIYLVLHFLKISSYSVKILHILFALGFPKAVYIFVVTL